MYKPKGSFGRILVPHGLDWPKYGQQPNSNFRYDTSRPGGQGHRKIYAMDPSIEDHRINFPKLDIHITLFLCGLFSYFYTSKPLLLMIEGTDEIYLMTPKDRWNLGSYACTNNEEIIMVWEGIITEKRDSKLFGKQVSLNHCFYTNHER